MIRLLIADDEEEIRLALRDIIPWNKHDIEVVGTAKNGQEAYELTEERRPDIALVDIKMPELDGLSFIERVRARQSGVNIIILSGYDNFEYTQEAIRLGAFAYILKPADPAEILSTVLQCAERTREEKKKHDQLKRFEREINGRLPLLKERFFSRLLNAQDSLDSLGDQLRFYRSTLDENQSVRAGIIRIAVLGDFNDTDRRTGFEIAKQRVIDSLTGEIGADTAAEVFEYANDCVLIYAAEEHQRISKILGRLVAALRKEGWYYPFAGIGSETSSLLEIHHSYRHAVKALDRLYYSKDSEEYLVEAAAEETINPKESYPVELEQSIIHALKTQQKRQAEEFLGAFLRAVEPIPDGDSRIREYCCGIYSAILHLCLEKGGDLSRELSEEKLRIQELLEAEDLSAMREILFGLLRLVYDSLKESSYPCRIVDRAADYIRENYAQSLTLTAVAAEVYVTPNYLSMLFKKELGINFLNFLHRCRIEKACTLLGDNSLKIYEIAEQLGYTDTKYFTQVFKKHTGTSPQQFRSSKNQ